VCKAAFPHVRKDVRAEAMPPLRNVRRRESTLDVRAEARNDVGSLSGVGALCVEHHTLG
jgi:hypothetical protein